MVRVVFEKGSQIIFSKLKDSLLKTKILKQVEKIKLNPELHRSVYPKLQNKGAKPMSYWRKGTRELYLKPFRLSYVYLLNEDKVYILDLYHKKKQ